MPTFEFSSPDGRKFQLDAPDALTAASRWKAGQSVIDQPQPQSALAAPKGGSGSVLPFSWDQNGVRFDSNAGLLGIGKNIAGAGAGAATLPGDVFSGKVNPNSDEAIGRAADFATFGTPMGAGQTWRLAPKVALPSAADLKATGGAGRDLARSLGVEYSTDSVVALSGTTQSELLQAGFGPRVAPQTNGILDDLQKVPDDPTAAATFSVTIEAARNGLQKIAQGATDGQERAAASRAISALDEFITRPDPGSVVAGPAAALGKVFKNANADYAAGSRSATLEAMSKRAALRSQATNSGLNLDNSIRQRVASFIEPNPNGGPSLAERSGFTESEIGLLRNIVAGKTGANTLRGLSNLLGGGGGLGAWATGATTGIAGASATGNPAMALLGLAVPTAGLGAKIAENAITRNALADAAKQLRTRSATYRERLAGVAGKAVSPAQRSQIIRTLLLGIPHAPLDTTGKPIPAGAQIY